MIPGTVRASFGIYNTAEEIDALARRQFRPGYVLQAERGEYTHPALPLDFASRFRF